MQKVGKVENCLPQQNVLVCQILYHLICVLQIANVLLHNKSKWDSNRRSQRKIISRRSENHPILIVCYTNHALDQFLEGIHQFHPKGIVRIGGRSQSEIMKECSLSELKHRMRMVSIIWGTFIAVQNLLLKSIPFLLIHLYMELGEMFDVVLVSPFLQIFSKWYTTL